MNSDENADNTGNDEPTTSGATFYRINRKYYTTARPPRSRRQRIVRFLLISAACLAGAFLVLFAPAFLILVGWSLSADDQSYGSEEFLADAANAAQAEPSQKAFTVTSADGKLMLVPEGFRAAPGAKPERYTNTGWAGEVIHEKTGIGMVFVPAGEFMMGADDGLDDGPRHRVILTTPFYMGKCEVTQAQWKAVVGRIVLDHEVMDERDIAPANPIYHLSCDDCRMFAVKAGDGLALPTEAQWEYACRAGSAGGCDAESLDAAAWLPGNSGDRLHAVATKRPNAWGLYDMLGNAREWCSDRWSPEYPSGTATDPEGPTSGADGEGVVRGPGICDEPFRDACACRFWAIRGGPLGPSGFRVVRNLWSPAPAAPAKGSAEAPLDSTGTGS